MNALKPVFEFLGGPRPNVLADRVGDPNDHLDCFQVAQLVEYVDDVGRFNCQFRLEFDILLENL